jgi:hypothetical protein
MTFSKFIKASSSKYSLRHSKVLERREITQYCRKLLIRSLNTSQSEFLEVRLRRSSSNSDHTLNRDIAPAVQGYKIPTVANPIPEFQQAPVVGRWKSPYPDLQSILPDALLCRQSPQSDSKLARTQARLLRQQAYPFLVHPILIVVARATS